MPISRALASAWLADERIDADHFVDIGMGQQQALDRVLPLPGLGQQELRAAADDDHAVADEFFQQLLERQHPRLAVDQGQEDERERVLQRRELVELVEHDLRIGVALQLVGPAAPALSDRFRSRMAEMPSMRSSFDQFRDPLFDDGRGLPERESR